MGSVDGTKVLSSIGVSAGSENSSFVGVNDGTRVRVFRLMSGRLKGARVGVIKIMSDVLRKGFKEGIESGDFVGKLVTPSLFSSGSDTISFIEGGNDGMTRSGITGVGDVDICLITIIC